MGSTANPVVSNRPPILYETCGPIWRAERDGKDNLRRPSAVSMIASARRRMISAMNYQERIVRDPQIVGGEPVLKGTRVTLKTVLASLAEGATTTEILADFPTLSEEDVRAAIAFAADSAQEDLPLVETPVKR